MCMIRNDRYLVQNLKAQPTCHGRDLLYLNFSSMRQLISAEIPAFEGMTWLNSIPHFAANTDSLQVF